MRSPRQIWMSLGESRPTPALVGLFLFVWLLVGFFSDTLTLLGPVRWLTGAMRDGGFSDGSERAAVLTVIGAYVASSFFFSLWTTRRVAASSRIVVRGGVPLALLAAAIGAFWMWTTPALVNSFQPVEVTSVSGFTFGPYPERQRFENLVTEGYTGVISLLNPTAVPFEAVLLGRERDLAEEFGIELIHVPLLPWIGGNEESLARVRGLAEQAGGRYYVHCYLGRDRVGMVRRLVEQVTPGMGRDADASIASVAAERAFKRGSFERGAILEVDKGVWFTPFPTDDELLRYFVGSEVRHVVSLLDPDHPSDIQWIDKESSALDLHGVSYRNMPLSRKHYSPAAALAAAEHVRRAERPVFVHGFRSDGFVSDVFRMAYASGLPPIPDGLFDEPMQGGQASIVGVNVVIGPRPAGPEFSTSLYTGGIRSVIYLGDGSRPGARDDRVVVENETSMSWRAMNPDAKSLLETLARGGPWYVYGPGLGVVQERIEGAVPAGPRSATPGDAGKLVHSGAVI